MPLESEKGPSPEEGENLQEKYERLKEESDEVDPSTNFPASTKEGCYREVFLELQNERNEYRATGYAEIDRETSKIKEVVDFSESEKDYDWTASIREVVG